MVVAAKEIVRRKLPNTVRDEKRRPLVVPDRTDRRHVVNDDPDRSRSFVAQAGSFLPKGLVDVIIRIVAEEGEKDVPDAVMAPVT